MAKLGIEIGANLNAKGFDDGMKSITRSLSNFSQQQFSARGGFFGGLVAAMAFIGKSFKDMVRDSKQLEIGSAKTGLDPEAFGRMRNALEDSGSSAEAYEGILGHLATTMGEARTENEKALESFADLGVTLDDLATKSRQRIFDQISDGLRDVVREGKLTERQLAALRVVFGKGATDILPFIGRGQRAEDAFGVPDEGQLARLSKAEERLSKLGGYWREVKAVAADFINDPKRVLKEMWTGNIQPSTGVGGEDESEANMRRQREALADRTRQRAKAQADARIAANEEQRKRETIAQLEAERDEALEKSLTNEERLARVKEKQLELQRALNAESDPVKRARLEATIAELGAQAKGLTPRSAGAFGVNVNERQRIGALISRPAANETRDTVAELRRANQLATLVVRGIDRMAARIERLEPFA